jgi:N-acetylglutamate synthase-like GNAT family acetyltransferase
MMIRRAEAADGSAIEGLYRELVADPMLRVTPDQIAALARTPTSILLVAEIDGSVCATALLTICPDAMYGSQPFGVIENIVVTQARRGCGIGRRLLAHMEQVAVEHACTKLMLLSNSARQDAHAFFQQCGFAGETKRAFVKYRRQFAHQ